MPEARSSSSCRPLHEGELTIGDRLVKTLVADQFPQWSDLPLRRVRSTGTVHAIYRVGDELAVRLPLLEQWAPDLDREVEWVTRFGAELPIEVPVPVAVGQPGSGYPVPWMIVKWIEGENATFRTLIDLGDAARRLGEVVRVLRGIDTDGVDFAHYKGSPLATRDAATRLAVDQVADEFDSGELVRAWEDALQASDWAGPPAWFHSDLHSGNLLARDGRLVAVIDWGDCAVGDPAIDAIAGWWLFDAESREVFREAAGFDDETWSRGRGWALSVALVALPYYVQSNPGFADMSRRAIREVLADRG